MKKHILFVGLLKRIFLFVCIVCGLFLSCIKNPPHPADTPIVIPITYNIYIENSIGMKGFFDSAIISKNNSASTFINKIYTKIDGAKNEIDTITFNFLNEKIEKWDDDLSTYLANANVKCTAVDTKVDSILKMAIESYQNDMSCVNIIVSDFIYSNKNGNTEQAKDAISSLVQKLLVKTRNLSIVILKYEAAYSGTYYTSTDVPIHCTQDLPLYVWFFGNAANIKQITSLANLDFEEIAVFQPHIDISPEVKGSARMTNNSTPGDVVVKDWKSNRRREGYMLDMSFSTDSIILNNDVLCDTSAYFVPQGYKIDLITIENQMCNMKISTQKPSPSKISFRIPYNIPSWVEDTNYDGSNEIPPIGKTEGIKYLIQGIYDAYNLTQKNIISINLNLIK